MNDPILLFLIADVVALLILAACTRVLPPAVHGFAATLLSGLGALLCLPPLLMRMPPTMFSIPIGPPGLSLYFALDPLALVFLLVVFVSGTAISAAQAASPPPRGSRGTVAVCLAGTALSLMAGDGIAMAVGLALACAGTGLRGPRMMIPILLLVAVCLLTPPGYTPRFDAIRAGPIPPGQATAAGALTIIAVAGLLWPSTGQRCHIRAALAGGITLPLICYLLLRLIADLSASAAQPWWGFVLLLAGAAAAIGEGWRSASQPGIDSVVGGLLRRQASLAVTGVGLALIARAADLPGSATYALQATFLTALGASLAGTLLPLAAGAISASAGTIRLSRLGGLVHTMPRTAAALAAGLLAISALPPGLGFASLWLSFQAILAAPRTGGLVSQLPLALAAAGLAASAALSTAASLRVVGIAILGRPRTPRGAGATESAAPIRAILLMLAAACAIGGLLPGPMLWLLAAPAVQALTGLPQKTQAGLGLLTAPGSYPGYLPLPVAALLALAFGAAMLTQRRLGRERKASGPWTGGLQPPIGLPFGDPDAQSAGAGFLPALPLPAPPTIPSLPAPPRLPAPAGIWLLLATFGVLLLGLALSQ